MELITGIHIDISGDELGALLGTKVMHHDKKAEAYREQALQLTKSDEILADEAEEIQKYTSNTQPADAMKAQVRHHRDKAIYYRFLLAFVIKGAVYRLDEADLRRIGVIS